VIIRRAVPEDCDSILELENECFDIPWSRQSIFTDLEKNKNAHYYVAVSEEVIGYIGMWLVLEDAQITNLAVTKKSRGRGVGLSLIDYLCEQAKILGGKTITLEVSDKNIEAKSLYNKAGFEAVSIRKKYYTHNNSDAIIMLKVIE